VRRSPDELAKMRRAGQVVAEMLARVREAARPGVTTAHLDAVARQVLADRGARSNFLGYHGFPAVICTSLNDVVVHGIPGDAVLAEGDVLSVDGGAVVAGYHGDAATTVAIGAHPPEVDRLLEVTEAALWAGIAQCRAGNRLHEIGRAVQGVVEGAGLAVVAHYAGHGIGTAMHEDPSVPNYWPGRPGPRLVAGQTLAVEPMVTLGTAETEVLADRWGVVSADGSLSAHFEHTVAVGADGPEVLTAPGTR
jgi:methionyl aminopeptidase